MRPIDKRGGTARLDPHFPLIGKTANKAFSGEK